MNAEILGYFSHRIATTLIIRSNFFDAVTCAIVAAEVVLSAESESRYGRRSCAILQCNALGKKSQRVNAGNQLLQKNKPIGSGIVESACKTVVQLRCKRAGQSWEQAVRFKSLLLSNQFDTAWDFIASHYRNTNIKLPDNVVPLRPI
jgi:hypothetical protein